MLRHMAQRQFTSHFFYVARSSRLKYIRHADDANMALPGSHMRIHSWWNQTPSKRWAPKVETFRELPARTFHCPTRWPLYGGKRGGVTGGSHVPQPGLSLSSEGASMPVNTFDNRGVLGLLKSCCSMWCPNFWRAVPEIAGDRKL